MNITLIGMPGSGKSFIGKKLAEKLGYEFFEPDKMLEDKYKLPLQLVLEKLGDESFLQDEADITVANLENRSNFVASPGGSIIYNDKAMKYLRQISTIIYLRASLPTLKKRIGAAPRGIVGLAKKTFDELYAERVPLYEKWSSITINADQDTDAVIKEILKQYIRN